MIDYKLRICYNMGVKQMKIRIYSNRHIKDEVQNVEKGDWIYLHSGLSRKRWAIYFRYNNIDESKLNLTYITEQELLNGEVNMKFDKISLQIHPTPRRAVGKNFQSIWYSNTY